MEFYASLEEELFLRANPSRPIPFSQVPIVLAPEFESRFVRMVSLLWKVLGNPVYRELSAESIPKPLRPPSERANPPMIPFDPDHNIGCIDLHLDGGSLRMIEFMVLPPGCVGVYPGMLEHYGSYLRTVLPDRDAHLLPGRMGQGTLRGGHAHADCGRGRTRTGSDHRLGAEEPGHLRRVLLHPGHVVEKKRHPGRDRRSARDQDAGRQNPGEGHAGGPHSQPAYPARLGSPSRRDRALHPHLVGISGDLRLSPVSVVPGGQSLPHASLRSHDPGQDGAIVLGG